MTQDKSNFIEKDVLDGEVILSSKTPYFGEKENATAAENSRNHPRLQRKRKSNPKYLDPQGDIEATKVRTRKRVKKDAPEQAKSSEFAPVPQKSLTSELLNYVSANEREQLQELMSRLKPCRRRKINDLLKFIIDSSDETNKPNNLRTFCEVYINLHANKIPVNYDYNRNDTIADAEFEIVSYLSGICSLPYRNQNLHDIISDYVRQNIYEDKKHMQKNSSSVELPFIASESSSPPQASPLPEIACMRPVF